MVLQNFSSQCSIKVRGKNYTGKKKKKRNFLIATKGEMRKNVAWRTGGQAAATLLPEP